MKIDQAAATVKDLRDQLYEKERLIEMMKCKIEQEYTALVRFITQYSASESECLVCTEY